MRILIYLIFTFLSLIFFVNCDQKVKSKVPEATTISINDSIFQELEKSIIKKTKFDCDYLKEVLPGDTPVVFAPGKISTGNEKGSLTFSPNGRELWFARVSRPAIYYMERKKDKWSKPIMAPFSGKYKDFYPYLSPDGKKLFFASNRPVKRGGQPLAMKYLQLWECRKMQSGWTKPRHVGAIVNFGLYHTCPAITSKGTLFYNLMNKMNDSTHLDIYESKYIYNTFAKPQILSESINSSFVDYSPYVSLDESYIIFSSTRAGYGKSDLFIAYKKPDGGWTNAVNMGPLINSSNDDDFPYVSPDGKYLFFNSTRIANNVSSNKHLKFRYIYWVSAKIIDKLKPNYLRYNKKRREDSL